MRTGRHNARNSNTRWEIILGVLFVVSFLGVTLALTIGDAIAAPHGSDRSIATASVSEALMRDDRWTFQ